MDHLRGAIKIASSLDVLACGGKFVGILDVNGALLSGWYRRGNGS